MLANNDEAAVEKAINMNIKGSIPYFYLYFLHRFKTVGVDGLTATEEVDLKAFVE